MIMITPYPNSPNIVAYKKVRCKTVVKLLLVTSLLIPESYSTEKIKLFQKKKHLNPTLDSKLIEHYFYVKGRERRAL